MTSTRSSSSSSKKKKRSSSKEEEEVVVDATTTNNTSTSTAQDPENPRRSSSSRRSSSRRSSKRVKRSPPPDVDIPIDTTTEKSVAAKLQETLDQHVRVAKEIILDCFQKGSGKKNPNEYWNKLNGTVWQDDIEICCLAFQKGLDVSKLSKRTILSKPEYVSQLILSTSTKAAATALWNKIDDNKMKQNKMVVFSALDRRAINISEMPSKYTKKTVVKKNFIQQIKAKRFRWKSLPLKYKRDVDFALAAVHHQHQELGGADIDAMLQVVVDTDRLWREALCKFPRIYSRFSLPALPQTIRQDGDIMLSMILQYPRMTENLHPSLEEDYEYVQKLIQAKMEVLLFFNPSTYEKHPSIIDFELLGKIAEEQTPYSIWKLTTKIHSRQWQDRGFVLKWVSAVGILHETIPDKFLNDEQIITRCLQSTNFHGYENCSSFSGVSLRLRSDIDFLYKVVRLVDSYSNIEGIFSTLPEETSTNFRLTLARCAKHKDFAREVATRKNLSLKEFHNELLEKYIQYIVFVRGFLCGATQGSGSPLVLLDSHVEIKRMIASYLDFPLGERLRHLIEAKKNLDGALEDEASLFYTLMRSGRT